MDTTLTTPRARAPAWPHPRLPFALFACLALALALRLHGLAEPSPWGDEIATWTIAQLDWPSLLGPIARVEPNPPGHVALLKLLGTGDVFALRLPSALAGAVAVLPVALVALRTGGPVAAVLAALLVALSALQIHHAQQGRGHALLFLAIATALWLLGPMLARAEPLPRRIAATAGFASACLVALHLHATAPIMVCALYAHALALLAMRDGPFGRDLALLGGAAAAILLGAAWWLRLAIGIAADPGSAAAWIPRPGLADSTAMLGEVLGGFHLGRLKDLAGIFGALLIGLGLLIAARRRQAEAVGLGVGFALGALALHSLSQARPMMLDRTALPLLAFAAPLIASGLAALRPRPLGLAGAALLLALSLRGTAMRAEAVARDGHGEDWRGAVAMLATRATPGDILLLAGAAELGAVPFLAPGLAARLRQRVAPDPAHYLDPALLPATGLGAWFAPGEACGVTIWVLARDLPEDRRLAALALPPAEPDAAFGHITLRRVAMPPCGACAGPAATCARRGRRRSATARFRAGHRSTTRVRLGMQSLS
jgi:mannosyltransferase